jgi:hypothetical protein
VLLQVAPRRRRDQGKGSYRGGKAKNEGGKYEPDPKTSTSVQASASCFPPEQVRRVRVLNRPVPPTPARAPRRAALRFDPIPQCPCRCPPTSTLKSPRGYNSNKQQPMRCIRIRIRIPRKVSFHAACLVAGPPIELSVLPLRKLKEIMAVESCSCPRSANRPSQITRSLAQWDVSARRKNAIFSRKCLHPAAPVQCCAMSPCVFNLQYHTTPRRVAPAPIQMLLLSQCTNF